MRLLSLHLTNFRLHADTHLDFPPEGIIGLSGPNESGKSTIPEAVMWALFGAAAIREKVADLRWQRAPKSRPAKAVLAFEVGGRKYEVTRTESDAVLHSEGVEPLAVGISGVDSRVPEILGMTLAEFEATYLCGQGDLARIATMKPTARKRFFMSVLGVGRVETAIEACRTKKNELRKYLEGLVAGLGSREPLVRACHDAAESGSLALFERGAALEEFRTVEQDRDAWAEKLKESDASREAANTLEIARGEAQSALTIAKRDVTEFDDRTAVVAQAKRAIESHGDLDKRLVEYDTERTRLLAAGTAHEQLTRVRRKLSEKCALLPDTVDYDAMAHEEAEGLLEQDRESLFGESTRHVELASDFNGEKNAAMHLMADLHDQDKALTGHDGDALAECPVCTQELTREKTREVLEVIADKLSTLSDRLAAIESETKVSNDDWETRQAQLRAYISARTTLIKRMEVVKTEHVLIGQLHATIEELETEEGDWTVAACDYAPERVLELGWLVKTNETAREERLEAQFVLETNQEWLGAHPKPRMTAKWAENTVAGIVKSLGELGFSADAHRSLALELQEKIRIAGSAATAVATAEADLKNADTAIEVTKTLLQDWEKKDQQRSKTAAELSVLRETDQRLGDFRTSMVEVIRPELEQLTSGFVGVLTDGRHEVVEIADDYSVTLFEDGVAQPVISGGAQSVVALAMRLAVSQMIAERAGHPLSLMILDEPFGSIDVTRRQNVLDLLRRLRATFKQVLVISHSDDIQNAVDTCFDFSYDGETGRSTVSQIGGGS